MDSSNSCARIDFPFISGCMSCAAHQQKGIESAPRSLRPVRGRLTARKGTAMLTLNDIQMLASRPERSEDTVLTLYLDVDQSNQANLNRGFERQFKDLLARA